MRLSIEDQASLSREEISAGASRLRLFLPQGQRRIPWRWHENRAGRAKTRLHTETASSIRQLPAAGGSARARGHACSPSRLLPLSPQIGPLDGLTCFARTCRSARLASVACVAHFWLWGLLCRLLQVGGDEGGVVEGGRHDQVLVGVPRQRGLRHVAQATDSGVSAACWMPSRVVPALGVCSAACCGKKNSHLTAQLTEFTNLAGRAACSPTFLSVVGVGLCLAVRGFAFVRLGGKLPVRFVCWCLFCRR